MSPGRREELVRTHRELRKIAFEQVYPGVDAYFRSAESALLGVKVAAEIAAFDPTLLKHFSEE